ncbi:ATP-binding protein [Neptunicella sp. SCSIO 80796]|uniref:ATP-binding protein n=1 Tax=Neptunicella plasticusilytica TaxID=3117012 RepID=UPI003A4D4328
MRLKSGGKKIEMRFFITGSLAVITICIALLIFFKVKIRANVLEESQQYLTIELKERTSLLVEQFKHSNYQIKFLYNTPPIQGLVRATQNHGIDPKDKTPYGLWRERLETIFTAFLNINEEIDQLRFIGKADNGREIVRVDRTGGQVHVVADEGLQSKAERYYFQDVTKLKPGEVYISRIDLNREYGHLVYPLVPTYRVAMPVFDSHQVFFGMVIINVNASHFLDTFKGREKQDLQIYLVDSNGDFVIHPNADNQFGLELGRSTSWDDLYTPGRKVIEQAEDFFSSTDIQSNLAFFYQRDQAVLPGDAGARRLEVVVGITENVVKKLINNRWNTLAIALLVVTLSMVLLLALYQNYINSKLSLNKTLSEFRAIVDGSIDAIVAMNKEGKVSGWNKAASEMFGLTEEQVMGKNVFQLVVAPEHQGYINDAVEKIYAGRTVDSIEVQTHADNNSVMDISVTLSPIQSTQTGISGVAAIIRDITEQKANARKVELMNANLEQQVISRTRELEQAKDQALAASRAKSAFVANMSHEIRTPMNGMFGMLNLIKRQPLSESQLHYLKLAEGSVETLSGLINDVLDLSKIESGKLTLEEIEFELTDTLATLFTSLSIRAQEKGLETILDLADIRHNKVVGDSIRIKQILTNLIGNAVKFTDQGEIELSARTEQSGNKIKLVCEVRDTGIGITPEQRSGIFDAFSQADSSTTRQFGGTGLGLSITRQLCQMMKGDISLRNDTARGSCFVMNIVLNVAADTKISEACNAKDKTMLIADSCQASRLALGKLATKLGYGVVEASDIQELEKCFSHADNGEVIDILLVDSKLLVKFHQLMFSWLAANSQVKVIALTSQLLKDSLKAIELTNITQLIKPVSPLELEYVLNHAGHPAVNDNNVISQTSSSGDKVALAANKILLVDDNLINREVAMGFLEAFNVDVVQAENGQQAIEALIECPDDNPFIFILMDCQMPVMDGFTATQKIRHGEAGTRYQSIPIIAITAGAMSGDRERCLKVGMSDYLTKPLVIEQFEVAMQRWLNASNIKQEFTKLESDVKLSDSHQSGDPVWDQAKMMQSINGNTTLKNRIIALFIDTAPIEQQALSEAIEQANFLIIAEVAHRFSGTLGSLAATRLEHIVFSIESAAKNNDLNKINQAWQDFAEQYPQLMRQVVATQS